MKRIDLILSAIEELDKGQGVSTIEISKFLSLERSNVSKDLNKLVSTGKLYKNTSRPVKYFLNSSNNIDFLNKTSIDALYYLYPSLEAAVKLAKTSILYPPNGMNSLIIGDTGVGKSMLAKLMHEYAQSLDTTKTMPFVHFNCSDYTNNPQLLSAHLFGVKKGTFTGATEDRAGLIEQADGGMLFLDEIHNLPNEGQEMLFVYMDTGYFKRFGEVSKQIKSTTRIICATNKDINSSLLDTFQRRIPIKINLPGLNERLLEERLTLIEFFLREESIKIDKPILVSFNSMLCLLSYTCKYNIGQLKNDITLAVANAFSDYFINNKKQIKINSPDLPEGIKHMTSYPLLEERKLLELLSFENGYISYNSDTEITSHSFMKQKHLILNSFTSLIKSIDTISVSKESFKSSISPIFQGYIDIVRNTEKNYIFSLDEAAFLNIIDEFIEIAPSLKNILVDDTVKSFLRIHLDLIYDRINLVNFNPLSILTKVKSAFHTEYDMAFEITSVIEKIYNLNVSAIEVLFLVLFIIHSSPENSNN